MYRNWIGNKVKQPVYRESQHSCSCHPNYEAVVDMVEVTIKIKIVLSTVVMKTKRMICLIYYRLFQSYLLHILCNLWNFLHGALHLIMWVPWEHTSSFEIRSSHLQRCIQRHSIPLCRRIPSCILPNLLLASSFYHHSDYTCHKSIGSIGRQSKFCSLLRNRTLKRYSDIIHNLYVYTNVHFRKNSIPDTYPSRRLSISSSYLLHRELLW